MSHTLKGWLAVMGMSVLLLTAAGLAVARADDDYASRRGRDYDDVRIHQNSYNQGSRYDRGNNNYSGDSRGSYERDNRYQDHAYRDAHRYQDHRAVEDHRYQDHQVQDYYASPQHRYREEHRYLDHRADEEHRYRDHRDRDGRW